MYVNAMFRLPMFSLHPDLSPGQVAILGLATFQLSDRYGPQGHCAISKSARHPADASSGRGVLSSAWEESGIFGNVSGVW